MAGRGIDYSKWDNLDVSSSEEERPEPRVTRLDHRSKVTIGGREGWSVEDNDVQPKVVEKNHECTDATGHHGAGGPGAGTPKKTSTSSAAGGDSRTGSSSVTTVAAATAATTVDSAAEGGDRYRWLYRNGRIDEQLAWAQTKDGVVLHLFVDRSVRGAELTVDVTESTLTIKRNGETLLEGEFPYKVVVEDDEPVLWEVLSIPVPVPPGSPPASAVDKEASAAVMPSQPPAAQTPQQRRAVHVTLRKQQIIPGASMWWTQLLKHLPEIPMSAIEDRQGGSSAAFLETWNSAHEKFKERLAERKRKGELPIMVDCGPPDDEDHEEKGGNDSRDRDILP
eukprot:GHVU01117757.1.p2 GENE.GHVU01117757.1~~GHVU01117757.1.p2  ORF type:complete len:337 (-),score=57.24 GHVU01117757.1:384-1394(-)